MLKDFTGDVQREIRRIHHALDEAEVLMHQLVALLHDHDAVGVERDAALVVAGEDVLVLLARDKQHRLVAHRALGIDAHQGAGVLAVAVLFLVPCDAVVVRHLGFGPLPDRDAGVDDLVLRHHTVVVLGRAVVVLFFGLKTLLVLDVHADRPADIVGVFLHQRLDLPDLQIGSVNLVVRVFLDVHDDIGPDGVAVTGRDGVAVRALAVPFHALGLAELAGDHGHLIGDHERGVKAHAELSDDGEILILCLFAVHFALELEGTALGDDAEVVLRFRHGHADAVIAHGDGTGILVQDDVDPEIVTVQTHRIVREGQIAELIDCVGCVGNNLAQENLFIRVDRIDHQVEKTLGFCLELLFCHF